MKRTIFTVRSVLVALTAVLIPLIAAMPAFAQSSSSSPCTRDIKEFCGTETPGGGRLLRCYEEKKDKMSADCRSWAEAAKLYGAGVKDACLKTIDARCNSEKGDPLEMLECLQSNYIDLTVECREKLNRFKERYPKPVQ
jgi:hypothetical protein